MALAVRKQYFRFAIRRNGYGICAALFRLFPTADHEKLWQFSAELVAKGFKILAVGNDAKFTEGNIPKTKESDKILLRACMKGTPVQNGSLIEVSGRSYEVRT